MFPTGHGAASAVDVDEFEALVDRHTDPADYPRAAEIVDRIPVYDGDDVRVALEDPIARSALSEEWAAVVGNGPGVFAIRRAYATTAPVDAMSVILDDILATETAQGHRDADHYAPAGANSRIWNTLQKAALADPEAFIRYYGNPVLDLVYESWLGPWYQVTAQLNRVHPGGAAQVPHRDYHLGFQEDADVARFPRHAALVSQALTLQGAIAHSDMAVETGPTLVLPYSQLYLDGYLAYRNPAFIAAFAERCTQLPLQVGDAMFFNPGLHHAAGTNRTADIERTANLVQVSSCMGIPMEAVDRHSMATVVYPVLLALRDQGKVTEAEAAAAVAACADGYPFPSNVDTDPPLHGLAPETAQALMHRALRDAWAPEDFAAALAARYAARRP